MIVIDNGSSDGTREYLERESAANNSLIYIRNETNLGFAHATNQGKTQAIDTKGNAPEDAQQKLMWAVQKAQTGNKLKITMDKTGKILSITETKYFWNE